MPAYDFKCNSCGERFTVRVAIGERQKVKCPRCGSGSLTQLFTSVNILGIGGRDCKAPTGTRFT